MRHILAITLIALIWLPSVALGFEQAELERGMRKVTDWPMGEKIAFWAEQFVGTPYDPDPLGEYVTREAIVADERVDCMYLTFRSVELSMAGTPQGAVETALDMRFKGRGKIEDDRVLNYDDRFQYAMDMIKSGKWGRDITAELPGAIDIKGARGLKQVSILPKDATSRNIDAFASGDIVYFIKAPEKRVVGEIIGHIGIIKREGADVYLIHASGRKNKGGEVKKVLFEQYISAMSFIGIIAGRF